MLRFCCIFRKMTETTEKTTEYTKEEYTERQKALEDRALNKIYNYQ